MALIDVGPLTSMRITN